MSGIKFTDQHEWVKLDGDIATIGISDYAAEQLGDVVFVELPESGREVSQSDELAVVESVKAASEIYAPISGTVIEVNADLEAEPAQVNGEPQGAGWFVKLKVSNAEELDALKDEAAYSEYVSGLS